MERPDAKNPALVLYNYYLYLDSLALQQLPRPPPPLHISLGKTLKVNIRPLSLAIHWNLSQYIESTILWEHLLF